MGKSLISKYNDNEFIKIVIDSETITDIATKLGYKSKGGAVTEIIKDRINKLNIDISHFNSYSQSINNKNKG